MSRSQQRYSCIGDLHVVKACKGKHAGPLNSPHHMATVFVIDRSLSRVPCKIDEKKARDGDFSCPVDWQFNRERSEFSSNIQTERVCEDLARCRFCGMGNGGKQRKKSRPGS
jgi:hypothetical protein